MKKITFIIAFFGISIISNFTAASNVYTITSGDVWASINNSGFASGDILELNGTTFTWSAKTVSLAKSFTVRAVASLTSRPIITLPTGVLLSNTGAGSSNNLSIAFDGIDINGGGVSTGLVSAKCTTGGDFGITINNCYIHNFTATTILFAYSNVGTNWSADSNYYSELKVTNSEFDGMATVFSCTGAFASPNKLTFSNCYFANMGGNVIGTALYHVPGGLEMNHCTFNNCALTAAKYELNIGFKAGVTTPAIIKNTLFANRAATSTTVNVFGTAVSGSPNSNNAVYYTNGTTANIYPATLNYSITSDPVIVNKVATSTDYLHAATDGLVIGYKGVQKIAPILVADIVDNDVDHNIDITFPTNSAWESAIHTVKIGTSTLTALTDYEITAGIIRLKPAGGNSILRTPGTKDIKVLATDYADAGISQTINVGAPSKLAVNTQPTAPEANGSLLVVQPSVFIQDQYGNATSSTASVVASTGSGSWTIGGTVSVTAVAGTATFTDLTATCEAAVTGATINFSCGSLSGVSSNLFDIPFNSNPTITVSTSALSDFSYIYGNGASASQSFTVNGLYMTAGVTITPSTNYEVSTDDVTFVKTPLLIGAAGTIASTTVYVRLSAGLPAASYNNEIITISSSGATSKTLTCSGSVIPSIITTTVTFLSGMDYVLNLGPSPERSFSVSSTNLLEDITVTAPANFEVSLTSGAIFTPSLTIPKNTTDIDVYVRLVADLALGNYTGGNITLTSRNATTQTVALTGSVIKAIASNELHNLPDPQADIAKVPRIKRSEYTAWPVNHGDAHVTLWDDDKVAALTITIDDNWETEHSLWLDMQQKYGLVFTWCIMTQRSGKPVKWDSFQNLLAYGHDVGSHTTNHLDLKLPESQHPGIFDEQYAPSVVDINTNLVGGDCQIVGYPYGFGDRTVAKKYFIGGRGTGANVNWADNINYIYSYSGGANDTTYIKTLVDPSVLIFGKTHYGDWTCTHFHDIGKVLPATNEYLACLSRNTDKIWVPWFKNLCKFGQERDSHTLTVTSVTNSKITFNLTDLMVDSIFNYPLTVKIRVNNDWTNVTATQDGKALYTRMLTYNGNQYVLVKAIPDRGAVEVINDVTQGLTSNSNDEKIILSNYRDELIIKGVKGSETIIVYSALGVKLQETKAGEYITTLKLQQGRVYLIQIGAKTYKVVL